MIIARAYLLIGAERWPDPGDPLGIELRLRHGEASLQDQLVAADFVARYRDLTALSHPSRTALIRQMRREQVEWVLRYRREAEQ